MMRILTPAGLALATVIAACAPVNAPTPGETDTAAEAASASPCFYGSQIRNFRTERNQKIYVRTSRDDVYELVTSGACLDLDGAIGLALVSRFGGASDRLCPSDQVEVVAGRAGGVDRSPCYARIERRLTAEELAALPSRSRP
ncbi:DUF6491 family protein [Brevundimonas sp.]|jgi:hypothetical protein|uniref:DUF6491 family protein n=1 Tax=Brevundimonas sp. TaxID=1871086 RepID=UPI002E117323